MAIQEKITVQVEEINQKVQAKEGRSKIMNKQHDKRIRRSRRRLEIGNTHQVNDTKKYQSGKCQAMMEYVVSGSRNSSLFTTDNQ